MSIQKPRAFISLAVDHFDGRVMATAFLYNAEKSDKPIPSFACLAIDDADLIKRLPEWLAALRAEAKLGRCESLQETADRLAGYSSGCTTAETTSLTFAAHIAAEAAEQGVAHG